MKTELATIVNISQLDERIRVIIKTCTKMDQDLEAFLQKLLLLSNKQNAIQHEIKESRQREHELIARVAKSQRRMQSAHNILESGLGPADAAERQISSALAVLDESETLTLNEMEKQDSLNLQLVDIKGQIAQREESLAKYQEEYPRESAVLRGEQDTLEEQRSKLMNQLPRDLQQHYTLTYDRRGTAVAKIIKNACAGCKIAPTPQGRVRVHRGELVTCQKCGRWLVTEETAAKQCA